MSLGSLNGVLRRIKMAKIHLKKIFIVPSSKENANQNNFETLSYPSQHSEDQHNQQQMQERMWERGNPHLLLVGLQTGSHSGSQFGESSKTKIKYTI